MLSGGMMSAGSRPLGRAAIEVCIQRVGRYRPQTKDAGTDKRFVTFLLLSFGVLSANMMIMTVVAAGAAKG